MNFIQSYVVKQYLNIRKLLGKTILHFMHIGKTGGSAIKDALKENSFITNKIGIHSNYIIVLNSHSFKFYHLKEDEKIFFVVRDPVSKFVSAFYSRYRMGQPRLYNPWKEEEIRAFSTFETPNKLAESIYSEDLELRDKAEDAMQSIGHVNTKYWKWFKSKSYLESHLDKVAYVMRQENLNNDFELFKKKFNLKDLPSLPRDEIKSHKTPDNFDKYLSGLAIFNIKKWYEEDYDFLDFLYSHSLITTKYERNG